MGQKILQKYKDLYFELGLTEHVLNDLVEELIEEIDNANSKIVLSEEALDVFIKYMVGGRPYYKGLEVNKDACIKHVEKEYPELQRENNFSSRFHLISAKAEDEHKFDTEHKVYAVNDHFIASDIQEMYVKELIKGHSHQEAINKLDEKFCITKNLHTKNKLVEAEKTTKAARNQKSSH